MFYNPYEGIPAPGFKWQKVQLHVHAGILRGNSCGKLPIAEVAEVYAKEGYDSIAITNHDMYMPYEQQEISIPLIDGLEYSVGNHTLLLGIDRYDFEGMDHQEIIDHTLDQGGFVIIAHPNFGGRDYWTIEEMERLEGYVGIEVIRAPKDDPKVFDGAEGFSIGKWDALLTKGKRVYGFGNDDFHTMSHFNKAWNMIYAKTAEFGDIKEAVMAGRFYTTTGMLLESFSINGAKIKVKASPHDTYTYRFIGPGGKLLHETLGQEAEFEVNPGTAYVRTEVISRNQKIMFLQPVFNF